MEITTPTTRPLSTLQMVGIILIANTAVRAIANQPAAPTIVKHVVEKIAEETTE